MDLLAEIEKLLGQWETDRRRLSTDDWQARIADTTLTQCINELRNVTVRAMLLENAG